MPSMEYQDMTVNVSWGGEFTIKLGVYTGVFTKEQMAEMIYPLIKAKAEALLPQVPPESSSAT